MASNPFPPSLSNVTAHRDFPSLSYLNSMTLPNDDETDDSNLTLLFARGPDAIKVTDGIPPAFGKEFCHSRVIITLNFRKGMPIAVADEVNGGVVLTPELEQVSGPGISNKPGQDTQLYTLRGR